MSACGRRAERVHEPKRGSCRGGGAPRNFYRAHDSRLRRDVAIKVSPEHFSERFEKEARAIAALNHSNICTLHDVGPNYLVMELVEGETSSGGACRLINSDRSCTTSCLSSRS